MDVGLSPSNIDSCRCVWLYVSHHGTKVASGGVFGHRFGFSQTKTVLVVCSCRFTSLWHIYVWSVWDAHYTLRLYLSLTIINNKVQESIITASFVFTSGCLLFIYVICVCLHIEVSNTYGVFRLVYPVLPVSLDWIFFHFPFGCLYCLLMLF